MVIYQTKSLERNSRLSVAMVKNRAEDNNLNIELGHLDKEKLTAMRMLQNDKQCFKVKYSKSSISADSANAYTSDEILSKYFVPSIDMNESFTSVGDTSRTTSNVDFQKIHNMLFTNEEIDKEKILCLHLISAHRTESLNPPKRKLAYMCKVHSPLERLLERSKRKHIHQEQRMANMLPIYTIETTEFGNKTESKNLINDGRLATRILLNERVRELINTVLNALRQSNPDKNYEIFEMASDVSCLKKLLTRKKILDFLDELMNCPLINSCESFILTAPFRVKSIQLEIRTITGTLETLVKQIRQNVLQLPARNEVKLPEKIAQEEMSVRYRRNLTANKFWRRNMSRKELEEGENSKILQGLYSSKQPRSSDPDKKLGRRVDTNFVEKNRNAAANAKKVEYDEDESTDYYHRPRRSSQSSSSKSRRSSVQSNIIERPNIQPIKIPENVAAIMEELDDETVKKDNQQESIAQCSANEPEKANSSPDPKFNKRKVSISDSENIRIHLKQTTCPACMERYKIPLPPPKTPRVKVNKMRLHQ
ncbi:uncharacterized protein LOC109544461 isoform X2 [Dendroctonus ponderosae]|uniref:Uncharacterized protein n=1 Tax=Dendroctonus ponderosae TaxID=77166 RepID=A0AAR5QAG5_DENPD|nr:uncharacterized protein LOC109544461 isoform X2 [Dendroctonus ponderosae]